MDAPEVSVDLSVALYHRTASPDPRGAAPAALSLTPAPKPNESTSATGIVKR